MADENGTGTTTAEGGNGNGSSQPQHDSQQNSQQQTQQNSTESETTFTQADVDRIVKERLERQAKKFSDYDDLKKAARQTKSVEDQVAELQAALAERDARDVERAGSLAVEKLKVRLVRDGLVESDAATIASSVDAMSLLDEGVPDEKAIDKLGASLAKAAGRVAPDPDQGRQNGQQPQDMNGLIRQAIKGGRSR